MRKEAHEWATSLSRQKTQFCMLQVLPSVALIIISIMIKWGVHGAGAGLGTRSDVPCLSVSLAGPAPRFR